MLPLIRQTHRQIVKMDEEEPYKATIEEVQRAINRLNTKKASDADGHSRTSKKNAGIKLGDTDILTVQEATHLGIVRDISSWSVVATINNNIIKAKKSPAGCRNAQTKWTTACMP